MLKELKEMNYAKDFDFDNIMSIVYKHRDWLGHIRTDYVRQMIINNAKAFNLKTNLTSKSLQTLKSVVDALNDNSQLNIVLSGHADERGTREYNLALGQRRADTVSQYLILNGVESNRITTKSYGEERPIANGQDEASYAKNRRVQIN